MIVHVHTAHLPPSHTARGLAEDTSMPNLDHTIKTSATVNIYNSALTPEPHGKGVGREHLNAKSWSHDQNKDQVYIYKYKKIHKVENTYMYMFVLVKPGNQSDKEAVPKGQPKPLWFQPEGIQSKTHVLHDWKRNKLARSTYECAIFETQIQICNAAQAVISNSQALKRPSIGRRHSVHIQNV